MTLVNLSLLATTIVAAIQYFHANVPNIESIVKLTNDIKLEY